MFKNSVVFILLLNITLVWSQSDIQPSENEFDFLEDEKIQNELNNVGKKIENISEAKSSGVKKDMTQQDCIDLLEKERSYMQKDIYRFATGNTITSLDLDGEPTSGAVGDEFGRWAKMGLSAETQFRVSNVNMKWAVHADPRCGPYFKIKKIDYVDFHEKRCRRAKLSIAAKGYSVLFCKGDNKVYVDHFNKI